MNATAVEETAAEILTLALKLYRRVERNGHIGQPYPGVILNACVSAVVAARQEEVQHD